jgi:hypothetical protein
MVTPVHFGVSGCCRRPRRRWRAIVARNGESAMRWVDSFVSSVNAVFQTAASRVTQAARGRGA